MQIALKERKIQIIILSLVLVIITLLTKYYGSTDLGDYSDTARYFAGNYNADIRSSHSYLYGFIHAPFIGLFDNYVVFKFSSLLFLSILIWSVYIISKKDSRALLLMLVSPVVWYMAPWINPIQLASIFLLWAYYFIDKYEHSESLKFLFYAGAFIGLGIAFWDTIVFFGAFLVIAYMYNRKLNHLFLLAISILVGLSPRLLLDYWIFGFPFFSLMKSFFGTLTNALFLGRGTSYSTGLLKNSIYFILIALSIPSYFFYFISKREFLKANKKTIIFLILSLLLIFTNPQIRYTLALVPIIYILIFRNLNHSQWKKQVIISLAIAIIFISPYLIQTTRSINNSDYYDVTEALTNLPNIHLTLSESDTIEKDLYEIGKDYPNETFVVIGKDDYYQKLAHIYWGKDIDKFVSVQDYDMWKNNETSIFEKKLIFKPKIADRRAIWVGGGILRNDKLNDFENVNYAIGLQANESYEGFGEVRQYSLLKVMKRN